MPQARCLRDRRHERLHPESSRPEVTRRRSKRSRRQEARGRRRLRRHVGGTPRPDPRGPRRVRRRARRPSQPARPPAPRVRSGDRPDRRSHRASDDRGGRVRKRVGGSAYIEAWLRGLGAVAIDNLMEDAATAEISRCQVWQWIHQDRMTDDGTVITREYVEGLIARGARRGRADPTVTASTTRRRSSVRWPSGGVPGVPDAAGLLPLPDRELTDEPPAAH